MNKLIHGSLVLGLLICLLSCDADQGLSSDDFQPKLVLNGIFNQEEFIKVELYGSRNILDENSDIDTIRYAQVSLYTAEDQFIGEFDHISDGEYILNNFLAKESESYIIRAEAEGYSDVQATSHVPVPMDITSITGTAVDYLGRSAKRIDIELHDLDEQDNFYVWEVLDQIEPGVTELPDLQSAVAYDVLLEESDLEYDQLAASVSEQSILFLSEHDHDSDVFNTVLYAFNGANQSTGQQDIGAKPLIVRLLTVSEDLYEYYRSVEFSRLKGNINSSVTQPINIYSNVEGGLGIFAGYAQVVKSVD